MWLTFLNVDIVTENNMMTTRRVFPGNSIIFIEQVKTKQET